MSDVRPGPGLGRLGGTPVRPRRPSGRAHRSAPFTLIKPVLETTPADLNAALALNVVGAAAAAGAVLPAMRASGRGTLLFVTGSAVVNPSAARAASAVAGSAENAYVELLADALADTPPRVAHLVVQGAIGAGEQHEADTVAARFWDLHAGSAESYAVLTSLVEDTSGGRRSR